VLSARLVAHEDLSEVGDLHALHRREVDRAHFYLALVVGGNRVAGWRQGTCVRRKGGVVRANVRGPLTGAATPMVAAQARRTMTAENCIFVGCRDEKFRMGGLFDSEGDLMYPDCVQRFRGEARDARSAYLSPRLSQRALNTAPPGGETHVVGSPRVIAPSINSEHLTLPLACRAAGVLQDFRSKTRKPGGDF